MKKTLMILTMGLFLGTIGFTSTAIAGDYQKDGIEAIDCKDDCKKDCCKDKKKGEKSGEAKACGKEKGKKACCSKGKKKE